MLFPNVALDTENFLSSHGSKIVNFSLFTPIRRPYYLRAVDTSRCHRFSRHPTDGLQIAGMQMRFLSCRLLEMLFTPAAAGATRKCIRNRRHSAAFAALYRKAMRFKYKVNYSPRAIPSEVNTFCRNSLETVTRKSSFNK